ncbi:hypothetical protein ACFV29_12795 [Streptomyces sp. NPDC059690]|uniref:hypothetical protein n=1 Tax=Streptomyces sp. NPDC059690 TaxID=3346907 RepID=UPI0036BDD70B
MPAVGALDSDSAFGFERQDGRPDGGIADLEEPPRHLRLARALLRMIAQPFDDLRLRVGDDLGVVPPGTFNDG